MRGSEATEAIQSVDCHENSCEFSRNDDKQTPRLPRLATASLAMTK
ncbi:MAG: hypothetical protein SOW25_00395 [Helicobacter sp.]|nr:hypothetical protein [Helicobacter sp.]